MKDQKIDCKLMFTVTRKRGVEEGDAVFMKESRTALDFRGVVEITLLFSVFTSQIREWKDQTS